MEMVINRRTDVVTTYKSIRNLSACVEKRGRVGYVVAVWEGRVGMGKKKEK
jgi:hypothetical protein